MQGSGREGRSSEGTLRTASPATAIVTARAHSPQALVRVGWGWGGWGSERASVYALERGPRSRRPRWTRWTLLRGSRHNADRCARPRAALGTRSTTPLSDAGRAAPWAVAPLPRKIGVCLYATTPYACLCALRAPLVHSQ